ncbi:SDR family oxidoreductase [Leucobacter weissii]|uniref:SDR family oxidoreductase n=1 Tax=Leucobacter weissii TaxID=1983706 RepID=A0A939MP95_9MICO|nr:NAD(P)-binding oxidoreductase [Leucobacter weissii]MBO1902227.1 SDR family oxidoreductase [Leucobacter weissii]
MRIVVLGATGNVGSRFIPRAVQAGHEVVAYARRPEAVRAGHGVTAVRGAAEDADALAAAARGADALLVTITGSTRDATFMQRTLPKVIDAAKRAGVDRIVLVSAFGAGDTAEKASVLARLIYRTVLRRFFGDKAASDRLLQTSGLDWTIVYPVNLRDAAALRGAAVEPLNEVAAVPGLPTLPFDDVADALVGIVADSGAVGERLLITTPEGWRPLR